MSLAPARRLAVVAAGALAAISIAACSPVLTHNPYGASDGIRVSWEDGAPIRGENVLLIAAEEGGDARVVGGLTNGTGEDVDVQVGFADGDASTITVPAGSTVLLDGSRTSDLVLPNVPGAPGSTVAMTFSTPSQGAVTLQVPVLDGTLDEYRDLVP